MQPEIAVTEPIGPADASVVVLGASLGTTAATLWEDVVPLLSQRFRVVLWDLPGHGAAPPAAAPFTIGELAAALADRIRTHGRVHVAGVSLAGAVSQQLVVAHPDLLRSAAIVCSSARFGEPAAWRERAARIRAEGTGVLVVQQAERWFAPGSVDARPGLTGRLLQELADADDESYALCCEALAGYDVREALRGATTPLLALFGEHDPVSPRADVEAIAAAVSDGRTAGIAGASHLAPAEQPAEVAAELIRFFEQHD